MEKVFAGDDVEIEVKLQVNTTMFMLEEFVGATTDKEF